MFLAFHGEGDRKHSFLWREPLQITSKPSLLHTPQVQESRGDNTTTHAEFQEIKTGKKDSEWFWGLTDKRDFFHASYEDFPWVFNDLHHF